MPAVLLSCADAPAVPVGPTQRDVAAYLVDLHAAGDDCRTRLKAVRNIVEAWPE